MSVVIGTYYEPDALMADDRTWADVESADVVDLKDLTQFRDTASAYAWRDGDSLTVRVVVPDSGGGMLRTWTVTAHPTADTPEELLRRVASDLIAY